MIWFFGVFWVFIDLLFMSPLLRSFLRATIDLNSRNLTYTVFPKFCVNRCKITAQNPVKIWAKVDRRTKLHFELISYSRHLCPINSFWDFVDKTFVLLSGSYKYFLWEQLPTDTEELISLGMKVISKIFTFYRG